MQFLFNKKLAPATIAGVGRYRDNNITIPVQNNPHKQG